MFDGKIFKTNTALANNEYSTVDSIFAFDLK